VRSGPTTCADAGPEKTGVAVAQVLEPEPKVTAIEPSPVAGPDTNATVGAPSDVAKLPPIRLGRSGEWTAGSTLAPETVHVP
jgi:hypothetical protein